MRDAGGRMASAVDAETWEAVRWMLSRGHRVVDVLKVYGVRGVTATAIYSKNHEHWHLRIARGRRGVRCIDCKQRRPNHRGGRCRECFNASERVGLRRGPAHPQWRGGKTASAKFIRFSPEYRAWRRAVFVRDDYTCVMCGARGGDLHADHIKPQSLYPELRLDLSNGRTLCVPCHRTTPTYGANARRAPGA